MSLMDRIKVNPWHELPYLDKETMIIALHKLRLNDQEEARIKKSRTSTKSARKNMAKRGIKVKDPIESLMKSLSKLTKEEKDKLLLKYKGLL